MCHDQDEKDVVEFVFGDAKGFDDAPGFEGPGCLRF